MDFLLSKNNDNSWNIEIINQLCKTVANITVREVEVFGYMGCYISKEKTILLNKNNLNKQETLRHELFHWAYEYELSNNNYKLNAAHQEHFHDIGAMLSEFVAVIGAKWGGLFASIAGELLND